MSAPRINQLTLAIVGKPRAGATTVTRRIASEFGGEIIELSEIEKSNAPVAVIDGLFDRYDLLRLREFGGLVMPLVCPASLRYLRIFGDTSSVSLADFEAQEADQAHQPGNAKEVDYILRHAPPALAVETWLEPERTFAHVDYIVRAMLQTNSGQDAPHLL